MNVTQMRHRFSDLDKDDWFSVGGAQVWRAVINGQNA